MVLLQQRDKGSGGKHAPLRVLPAHQRLRTGDPPVAQTHLGLQEQHELPVLQGAVQLVHQLPVPQLRLTGIPGVKAVAQVAARGLARLSCLSLHNQQVLVGARRYINAEAQLNIVSIPPDLVEVVHGFADPLQTGGDLILLPVFQQEAKYLPGHSAHRLIAAQVGTQHAVDMGQQPFALLRAEGLSDQGVVHDFHGNQGAAVLSLFPQLFHRQLEAGTVGAAGDGVQKGSSPDLLPLGMVHDGKDRHHSRDQPGSRGSQQTAVPLQNLHPSGPPFPIIPAPAGGNFSVYCAFGRNFSLSSISTIFNPFPPHKAGTNFKKSIIFSHFIKLALKRRSRHDGTTFAVFCYLPFSEACSFSADSFRACCR